MKAIDFRYDLLPLKDKLFRLALRITLDRAEAEDVTQDTLIRVWEKRNELAELKSLEAYVLTIGRNLALDRSRKSEAANLSIEEGKADAPDTSPPPDERMEMDERLKRVPTIFNQVPEPQRSVMQLRDIEAKSYKEIAEVTGLTEANVKVTLHRARQAVRQQYEKIEKYGL